MINPHFKTLLEIHSINYDLIKKENLFIIHDTETEYDINFIIPVRGRVDFAAPMYDSFLKAKNNTNLKIGYTIVEISDINEHQDFCATQDLNYIWIKRPTGELFNKSLGLNVGAIFSLKAKAFIFHDIDCLIQSNFFIKLEENIRNKNAKAIQTFHGRRVLYLNDALTNAIINKIIDVDSFHLGYDGISLPENVGAPGGSIYVSKEVFFEVGGYDPELFSGNAPEDIFFWDKVSHVGEMHICDNPQIDIFHMNHPLTANQNPLMMKMITIHNIFRNDRLDNTIDYINHKKELLSKFYE